MELEFAGGARPQELRVECHLGYKGEETPRAFELGRRRLEVSKVMDRWLAPEHRYFKVASDDGHTYVLRHDVAGDYWELTMFMG